MDIWARARPNDIKANLVLPWLAGRNKSTQSGRGPNWQTWFSRYRKSAWDWGTHYWPC